jgi:hypothetical protein
MSELKVVVKRIGKTQQITEKFKKRELVVDTKDEKYPQVLIFQGIQDMCEKMDELRIEDDITINYNLKGREYNAKDGSIGVFNTLEMLKFHINQTSANTIESDNDDLPF